MTGLKGDWGVVLVVWQRGGRGRGVPPECGGPVGGVCSCRTGRCSLMGPGQARGCIVLWSAGKPGTTGAHCAANR